MEALNHTLESHLSCLLFEIDRTTHDLLKETESSVYQGVYCSATRPIEVKFAALTFLLLP